MFLNKWVCIYFITLERYMCTYTRIKRLVDLPLYTALLQHVSVEKKMNMLSCILFSVEYVWHQSRKTLETLIAFSTFLRLVVRFHQNNAGRLLFAATFILVFLEIAILFGKKNEVLRKRLNVWKTWRLNCKPAGIKWLILTVGSNKQI